MKVRHTLSETDFSELSAPHARPGELPAIDIGSIVWACDFSPASAAALHYAARLARVYGSDFTAVHVSPDHTGAAVEAALRKEAELALANAVPVDVVVRQGRPAEGILGVAAGLPADLVAMGCGPARRVGGRTAPSTVDTVLGHARCPVLVVPAGEEAPGSVLRTIVCAIDFSARSDLVLEYAVDIASQFRSRILLVHVVEGECGMEDRRIGAADARLQEAFGADRLARDAESIVTTGSAPAGIIRIAREHGAGLIVLGVRGFSALHTVFFGSTAHTVVRKAPCAVLAVSGRRQ